MVIALTYPTPMRGAVLERRVALERKGKEGGDKGQQTKAWSSLIFLITASFLPLFLSLSP